MAKLIEPHGGKGLTICLLEGAELDAEKQKAAGLKKVEISPDYFKKTLNFSLTTGL